MIRRVFALFLLILCLAPARAQRNAGQAEKAQRLWESFSPARREHILLNYRRYQKMSPEEKQKMKKRFTIFQSLPKKSREELVRKWRRFQSLTPAIRRELQRNIRHASHARARERSGPDRERGVSRERESRPPVERGPREHGGPGHEPGHTGHFR